MWLSWYRYRSQADYGQLAVWRFRVIYAKWALILQWACVTEPPFIYITLLRLGYDL